MKSAIILSHVSCASLYQYGCGLHDFIASKGIEKFCIQIHFLNRVVYQFMNDACTRDNAQWLQRKSNSVLYFGMSTKDLFIKNGGSDDNIVYKYGLDRAQYTFTPGGVPIVLKGCGIVGSVAVSGMKPEEDHGMMIDFFKTMKVSTEMK